jgi:5-methylcytosine-specific restriction protein A
VSRNPTWVEDELLVVLDLYLAERRVLEENDPRVVEASKLLNRLPIHPEAGQSTFRTPDAVVLRLANFRSYDPNTAAKGMSNAGRLAQATWRHYADDPATVRELVTLIRTIAGSADRDHIASQSSEPETAVPEGVLIYRMHRQRERDPRLRARKLKDVAMSGRQASCEVCGLVPEVVFGAAGARVLECHHLKPLRLGQRGTLLADTSLVCANCHRALHGRGLLITPKELRDNLPAEFITAAAASGASLALRGPGASS